MKLFKVQGVFTSQQDMRIKKKSPTVCTRKKIEDMNSVNRGRK